MLKYTVILKLVGYFFGGTEDNFCLLHVEAESKEAAVKAAHASKVESDEMDLDGLAQEGGADEVMPALYVFPGHIDDLLSDQNIAEAA